MRRYRVELDPVAIADRESIREHVSRAAGTSTAEHLIDRLLTHIEGFDIFPKRGRARDEIRPGLRTIGWRRIATLVYLVDDNSERVVFLGVPYRGRDVEGALRDRLG